MKHQPIKCGIKWCSKRLIPLGRSTHYRDLAKLEKIPTKQKLLQQFILKEHLKILFKKTTTADLSSKDLKEPHMQVGVEKVIASGSLDSILISTLALE